MEKFNYLPLLLLISLLPCNGFMIKHILMESESPPPATSPELKIEVKRVALSIFSGIITGFIAAILVAAIIRCFVHYINRPPILKGPVVFSPKIDPKTLRLALENENHIIGSSPNGTYYRTALDNGLNIAVKRLEPFEIGSPQTQSKALKRKLQQELQVLAALRHRHLMSLRAYVRESDRFSLVYDYMPTGSLEDAMNKVRLNQLQMGWDVRLRIAVGIIKALKFLHFESNSCILHYNLKPSNVMLDVEFEPKLADCGLANLMPKLYRSSNGYNAPESSQSCRYTDKSDVFSFGVILGVLLTGRDPLDPFFGESASGGSLGRWLRHLQQAGEAQQALDKSILGQEVEEDEMLMVVRIAVVCMSDLPEDRPSSDELVPMLSRLHSF
ncbi:inactive leucine-rich repeat receptor-like protein kinase CORYNE [Beta vulgaris subsp. vulgaris]|uniref:inactive leucine-rich repeat receptor-like protein kinase CORYNE n=1 Tax=Beta vulgaris subsp. vulgaris TaxID=3555 RepID=UPI002036EFC7|nr:inactive leucine-rich repeat receptor-like protein kinase CORYNE [Beta vulgaris subsp. vulgaris]